MLPYRHTQPGTVLRWTLGLSVLPLGLAFRLTPVPPPHVYALLCGVAGLLLLSLILFWSLSVEITPGHFRFWFGPGLIRKSVPIPAIAAHETVDGVFSWGIHWAGRRGWLYNVSGRQAVALTLRDGKRLMVGTDEPAALCAALDEARTALQA